MQGLALFRKLYPKHRRKEIDYCISKAIHYIEKTQNPDGSWYFLFLSHMSSFNCYFQEIKVCVLKDFQKVDKN